MWLRVAVRPLFLCPTVACALLFLPYPCKYADRWQKAARLQRRTAASETEDKQRLFKAQPAAAAATASSGRRMSAGSAAPDERCTCTRHSAAVCRRSRLAGVRQRTGCAASSVECSNTAGSTAPRPGQGAGMYPHCHERLARLQQGAMQGKGPAKATEQSSKTPPHNAEQSTDAEGRSA